MRVHFPFFYPSKHHDLCPGYTGLTSLPQGPRHPNKIRDFMSLIYISDNLNPESWSRSTFQTGFKKALRLWEVAQGEELSNQDFRPHTPSSSQQKQDLFDVLSWLVSE